MKIEMTIWDNATTTEEKQDLLRFCERAALRVWRRNINGAPAIKTRWSWAGIIMEIEFNGGVFFSKTDFLRSYNNELCKLAAWNDPEDRLVMEWELEA